MFPVIAKHFFFFFPSGEPNRPQGFPCDRKDVLAGSATAGLASVLHSPAFYIYFCIFLALV